MGSLGLASILREALVPRTVILRPMYVSYFGLKQAPFSIAPDPRYLYMSERHREALAHLLYGLGGGGGFVVLTGEIGAGKTTVCRCFLEQVPAGCAVAYIFNPKLTVVELLQSVCDEFGVAVQATSPPTVKDYIDPLNRFLLDAHAAGRHSVLVIDEAQNLSAEVLEQLRLLTNLETDERKLLQILLIGQPELRSLLARADLEQLAQRVIARYHLGPLNPLETAAYVGHRLAVAGLVGASPIGAAALRQVQRLSRGVPRRINLLCDRALLGAYAQGRHSVDGRTVRRAATEVFGLPAGAWRSGRLGAWGAAGLVGAALVLAWWTMPPVEPVSRGGPAAGLAAIAASVASSTGVAVPANTAAAIPASAAAAMTARAATPLPAAAPARIDDLPRDERQAWRSLASAWGQPLGEGDPCQAARTLQLLCYRSAGTTLAALRLLDRPGLLALRGDDGQVRHAELVALPAQGAILLHQGQRLSLPLDRLAERWRGDFATLWRAPAGYAAPLAHGARGAAVDALAQGLASLRGEPPPAAGQALLGDLAARLSSFQLAQGLQPDGVAGPTTFMRLNRALGLPEPRLPSNLGPEPGR